MANTFRVQAGKKVIAIKDFEPFGIKKGDIITATDQIEGGQSFSSATYAPYQEGQPGSTPQVSSPGDTQPTIGKPAPEPVQTKISGQSQVPATPPAQTAQKTQQAGSPLYGAETRWVYNNNTGEVRQVSGSAGVSSLQSQDGAWVFIGRNQQAAQSFLDSRTPAPATTTGGGSDRLLGPTEFNNLVNEWRQSGLTDQQIEQNMIRRDGQGNIYLRGDAPSTDNLLGGGAGLPTQDGTTSLPALPPGSISGPPQITPFSVEIPSTLTSDELTAAFTEPRSFLDIQGLLAEQRRLREQYIAALTPTTLEQDLAEQLNDIRANARSIQLGAQAGIDQQEQETIPTPFIRGRQKAIADEARLDLGELSVREANLIDALGLAQEARLAQAKGIDAALGFIGQDIQLQFQIEDRLQRQEDRQFEKALVLEERARDVLIMTLESLQGYSFSDLAPDDQTRLLELGRAAGLPPALIISSLETAKNQKEYNDILAEYELQKAKAEVESQQALTAQRLSSAGASDALRAKRLSGGSGGGSVAGSASKITFEEYIQEQTEGMSPQEKSAFLSDPDLEEKYNETISAITVGTDGKVVKGKQEGMNYLTDIINQSPDATYEELYLLGRTTTPDLSIKDLETFLRSKGFVPALARDIREGSQQEEGSSPQQSFIQGITQYAEQQKSLGVERSDTRSLLMSAYAKSLGVTEETMPQAYIDLIDQSLDQVYGNEPSRLQKAADFFNPFR